MAETNSRRTGIVVALLLAVGAIAVWNATDREPGSSGPDAGPADETTSAGPASGGPSDSATEAPEPTRPPAPALRIAESGRLALDASSLPAEGTLALGLDLGDEARGSGLLSVVIASTDGRRIETTAVPTAGAGSGVRLELDPAWLLPGRYMLHVTTAEKTALHFRRYVLEVN